MKLAWSAIVKNESAIIERCVKSLLPHIDCAIVVDTGSTDGTPDIIAKLFDDAGKDVQIERAPFVNFEQARNVALQVARQSELAWDYLLLADADMELKVNRPGWFNGGRGLSYDMRQVAGSVSYFNRRLVSRAATGGFVGVTHEYLDIPAAGVLDGAEFIDHADGANRPEKFQRDIALLEAALPTETRPGLIERYHFYLAQSYFDAGNWPKAAKHYRERVALGGFDEERWNAQLHLAHCLENMGDKGGFVWEMLRAYHMRPQRAETLYDLAKYFRERGENYTSLLFSEAGLQVPHPKQDLLFINDYVYHTGLREEFAICAYYDPARRQRGAAACNELALSRAATNASRETSRNNLYWYLKPLSEHVPSFSPHRIDLPVSDGYVAMNPSVINEDGRPTVLVRTVNYTITPEGQYAIRSVDGAYRDSQPICTRNHLVRLSSELTVEENHELAMPADWPEPKFDLVRGFEDSRLFASRSGLWTISTVRELTQEGWCEQVMAPLIPEGYSRAWQRILPKERRHEKNWAPWMDRDGCLAFVYRLGALVDSNGKMICQHDTGLETGHISGGSQVIDAEGTYLALVHEARTIPGRPNRYYAHRFVILADDARLERISPPFMFFDRQIEFAAGLAYFPEKRQLMASFGVRDAEAWLAWMDLDEVLSFIGGAETKP